MLEGNRHGARPGQQRVRQIPGSRRRLFDGLLAASKPTASPWPAPASGCSASAPHRARARRAVRGRSPPARHRHPLHQAAVSAEAISNGDLSRRPDAEGKDETARLLQALSLMQDNLARIVGDVRAGIGKRGHRQRPDREGQPRPASPHRGAGQRAGGNRGDDGPSSARRCSRPPRTRSRPTAWRVPPARWRSAAARWSSQVVDTMKRHRREQPAHRRHHRHHRRHRLPDQHPGAERRRRSRAGR